MNVVQQLKKQTKIITVKALRICRNIRASDTHTVVCDTHTVVFVDTLRT